MVININGYLYGYLRDNLTNIYYVCLWIFTRHFITDFLNIGQKWLLPMKTEPTMGEHYVMNE